MTKCNIEKFNRDTVKLYDDSASPEFLVVIKATPNWVRTANVGMLTLKIFPGLYKNMEVYNAVIPHKWHDTREESKNEVLDKFIIEIHCSIPEV